MAVIEDVGPLGAELERSYQVYVHGRLKFGVKQIGYVAFSLDETVMGFAFPKEERAALVASDPHKFQTPSASDMRFNWVHADLAAPDPTEARELVVDAWRTVVPKKLSRGLRSQLSQRPGLKQDLCDRFGRLRRASVSRPPRRVSRSSCNVLICRAAAIRLCRAAAIRLCRAAAIRLSR